MRIGTASLVFMVCVSPPTASVAGPLLWNGIAVGSSLDELRGRLFVDARQIFHALSRRSEMTKFYIQHDDAATIRILYDGWRKEVCGVDVEGERASLEKAALVAELGPATSSAIEELLNSPGGSAALLSGGKMFRVWTWQKGSTLVTFEARIKPGYFITHYRQIVFYGRRQNC